MNAISLLNKQDIRKETDNLGEVNVPSDKLWERKRNVRWSTST
jgi:fumarate hydratase class II